MEKKHNKGFVLAGFILIFLLALALLYWNFAHDNNDITNEIEEVVEEDITEVEEVVEEEEIELIVSFDDAIQMNTTGSSIVYKKRDPIKGIYVTANSAGTSRLDDMIEIANTTEVNAFVIDVKSDDGRVTFDMDIPLVDEIGAEYLAIKDIDEVMDKLYDNNIYPIARVVVFKDPFLSKKVNDYAVKNKDGSLFIHNGVTWLNPYDHETWEYVVNICKEAAKVGFKEIQFDYIRFGERYRVNNVLQAQIDTEKSKEDIILDFLDYANKELEAYDVELSADVFGTVITSKIDADIVGQNYVEMSRRVDVICPMVYPSHYGRGYYGIPYDELPDSYPYNIIYGSMSDSNEKLAELSEEEMPITRPWLQAFTMNGVSYGGAEIRAQIQAAYDAGLSEWILWNAGNYYNTTGLEPEEAN